MSKKIEDIPKSERSEIVNNILGAKDRKEQLKIEADLHLTSVTTIKEILKDYGVNLKIFNGGSRKKKRIEDELAEEQEIITPVEEIETVEEQAEQDEIGQAWADLSIPPDVDLPPLTVEPLPPLSNEERVCEPIHVEQAEKIPYTKPEILDGPPLPKSSKSAENAAECAKGEYAPSDDVLFVGQHVLDENIVYDAIREKANKLIARRKGLVAEIGHIDVLLKKICYFYEDLYSDISEEGVEI